MSLKQADFGLQARLYVSALTGSQKVRLCTLVGPASPAVTILPEFMAGLHHQKFTERAAASMAMRD